MRCNNSLSLIHFCKQITGYCIASVNYYYCKVSNLVFWSLFFNAIMIMSKSMTIFAVNFIIINKIKTHFVISIKFNLFMFIIIAIENYFKLYSMLLLIDKMFFFNYINSLYSIEKLVKIESPFSLNLIKFKINVQN
jgi:hypothetical protein